MPISVNLNLGPLRSFGAHKGSAPSPFDALNGPRLAGPQGSHPLHSVRPEELVRPTDGAVNGEIVTDGPARIGEGITGTIRLAALKSVSARSAAFRLVGLRLDEIRRSEEDRDSDGHVTHSEQWVEAQGKLFAQDAFIEPQIPAAMQLGEAWEGRFAIPAPPLGPPTAHLGESIVAWALEVRWDVALGSDHFVAAHLPVAQHPDLLRAGVGKQGGRSVMDIVPVGDARITVMTPLPAPAGSEMAVRVEWPSAPGGQGARVELHRRTNAPNGVEGIVAAVAVAPEDFRRGPVEVRLAIPPDAAPSFDGAGLEITYIIRALIDRRFRSDAAVERPVAIV